MLLFDEMELAHTCCRPGFWNIEPPWTLRKLEKLLMGTLTGFANSKRCSAGLKLNGQAQWTGFLGSSANLLRRISLIAIASERETVSIAQALRDLGVVLQEVTDDDTDTTIGASWDEADPT